MVKKLLTVCCVLAGCRVPQSKSPLRGHDELRLSGLEMRVWRRDELVVQLGARELTLTAGTVVGRGVTVRTSQGELAASRLEFDLRTNAASASGEVRGSRDGWVFTGSQVRFRRDGVVLGEAPFELAHGSVVRHRGGAFEWDPVGAVAVISNLSSVMEREGQPVTLRADRVDYRETPRTAQATGNVVIDGATPARATLRFVPGQEGVRLAEVE